jgi:hypothetical protein
MDEQLLLAPEQRTRITKSLVKNWNKDWAPQIELFMMNTNMWPRVPDQWVTKELTPAQRAVWARLQANPQYMVWGGGGFAFGDHQLVIDDIELPAVAEPAGDKKKP